MTAFKRFGVMIDCSRNAVINYETFKKIVDILSDLGYNSIRLYMEDTYEISEEPYFGYLRGRYSKKELKEIDEYAFGVAQNLISAKFENQDTWGAYGNEKEIGAIPKNIISSPTLSANLLRNSYCTLDSVRLITDGISYCTEDKCQCRSEEYGEGK